MFFFVALVLSATNLVFAADQNYTDLGTAQTLEVTESKLSEAQVNSGSNVTVITQAEIQAYRPESTADLIGKAIGTSFNSYGALGALQTVSIRGMGSARTMVYLDGVKLNSAHDLSTDLSIITPAMIDHIEIIKSGSGNLGKTVAAGGIVNIVTKKAVEEGNHYEISFENGSYLNKKYYYDDTTTETSHNVEGLVDSQRYDFTFMHKKDDTSYLLNVGGYTAGNLYTYEWQDRTYRKINSEAKDLHLNFNLTTPFMTQGTLVSNNMLSYQKFNTAGSLAYGYSSLTTEDYQRTVTFSTKNQVSYGLVDVGVNYEYAPLHYHSMTNYGTKTYTDDNHKKHKLETSVSENLEVNDDIKFTIREDLTFDYVDSTKFNRGKSRWEPQLSANGSMYFLDGRLGLFPMASISYVSDFEAWSPEASLGTTFVVTEPLALSLNVGYAENYPSFSQLYWDDPWYKGNEDLDQERITSAEASLDFNYETISYKGTLFARYMKDAIVGSYTTTPNVDNLSDSAYFGTEQTLDIRMNDIAWMHYSYLWNRSYDLSGDNDFDDDVRVDYVREHSFKMGFTFKFKKLTISNDLSYLGKTESSGHDVPYVYLVNVNFQYDFTKNLTAYLAIDNLFDEDYYYSYGYPMPGMKIRLGGTWKF